MAISFIGTNTSTTATVNKPSGTADGDLVIIHALRGAAGGSTLTGFTQFYTANFNAFSHSLLYKIASGEGASWTVTNATDTIVNVLRGAAVPSTSNTSTTSGGAISITTVTANSWLYAALAGASGFTAPTIGTPSDYTARGTGTQSVSNQAARLSSFIKEAAQPIGSYSVNNPSGNLANAGVHFEIPPTAVVRTTDFMQFFD